MEFVISSSSDVILTNNALPTAIAGSKPTSM
jgi:hypothetical protein